MSKESDSSDAARSIVDFNAKLAKQKAKLERERNAQKGIKQLGRVFKQAADRNLD